MHPNAMWNIYEYLVFILPLCHVSVLHDTPKSYLVVPGAIGRDPPANTGELSGRKLFVLSVDVCGSFFQQN